MSTKELLDPIFAKSNKTILEFQTPDTVFTLRKIWFQIFYCSSLALFWSQELSLQHIFRFCRLFCVLEPQKWFGIHRPEKTTKQTIQNLKNFEKWHPEFRTAVGARCSSRPRMVSIWERQQFWTFFNFIARAPQREIGKVTKLFKIFRSRDGVPSLLWTWKPLYGRASLFRKNI